MKILAHLQSPVDSWNLFFLSCRLGQERHQEKEILSDCKLVPFSSNNWRFQSINFWCSKACPPFCFYKLIKLFIWYQEPPEGSNLYFNLWRNSYPRYCCRTIFKVINTMLGNFQLKVDLIRPFSVYLFMAWFKKYFAFHVPEEVSFYYIYFAPFNASIQEDLGDKVW